MALKKKKSSKFNLSSGSNAEVGREPDNDFIQPNVQDVSESLLPSSFMNEGSHRKRKSETSENENDIVKKKMLKERKKPVKIQDKGHISKKGKAVKNVPTSPDSTKKSMLFTNKKGKAAVSKTNTLTGKPDWKEMKERKKVLKQTRKQKNPTLYDIAFSAKKIYEFLKMRKVPKKERTEKVQKLYHLLKGHFTEFVYKHDMTRVIQLLLKLADEVTRTAVTSELKPEMTKMAQSMYASHTLKLLIQVGSPAVKTEMLSTFKGSIVKLLKTKESADVIRCAYRSSPTAEIRSWMRQEFAGFTFNKTASELLEVVAKTGCFASSSVEAANVASLINLVREPADDIIMITLKEKLMKLIEKGLAANDLVQSVLNDYLMKCSPEIRGEFLGHLQPSLEQTIEDGIDTLDRALALVEYAWFGSSKERKWLVKQLRPKMPDVCFGKSSYFVVISILDCMDDTVFLKKTLVKDIIENRRKFVEDKFGWKVIMHIVSPRDPKHFSPSYLGLLELGDATARKKKPDAVRHAELLQPVLSAITDDITSDLCYWLSGGRQAILTRDVLAKTEGSLLQDIFKMIAKFVCHERPFWQQGFHHEQWIVEELVLNDRVCFQKNNVAFSSLLLEEITEKVLNELIQKRSGFFVFKKLMGTGISHVQDAVVSLLKPDILTSAAEDYRDKFYQLLKPVEQEK